MKRILLMALTAMTMFNFGCQKGTDVEPTDDINSIKLNISESKQLEAIINPLEATDKTLIWTSTDPTIVSVTEAGLMKAMKPGMAYMIAKSSKCDSVAKCKVRVMEQKMQRHCM